MVLLSFLQNTRRQCLKVSDRVSDRLIDKGVVDCKVVSSRRLSCPRLPSYKVWSTVILLYFISALVCGDGPVVCLFIFYDWYG